MLVLHVERHMLATLDCLMLSELAAEMKCLQHISELGNNSRSTIECCVADVSNQPFGLPAVTNIQGAVYITRKPHTWT